MSFKSMKVEDLLFVANDDLGLDLPEGTTKPVILAAIAEKEITWEQAVELSPMVEEQDEIIKQNEEEKRLAANQAAVVTSRQIKETPVTTATQEVEETPRAEDVVASVVRPAKTLIKMDRENPTFSIRGYKFTQANPFVLATEEDAEYLVGLNDGFYYATPKEAAEFYG